jgi:hypothetical protein
VRGQNSEVFEFSARFGSVQDAAVPLGKRLIPDA